MEFKNYYVSVPGQQAIVVPEAEFEKRKESLYKQYPDAVVAEATSFKQDDDFDDNDMFDVSVQGKPSVQVSGSEFRKRKDALYRQYPSAVVNRYRPIQREASAPSPVQYTEQDEANLAEINTQLQEQRQVLDTAKTEYNSPELSIDTSEDADQATIARNQQNAIKGLELRKQIHQATEKIRELKKQREDNPAYKYQYETDRGFADSLQKEFSKVAGEYVASGQKKFNQDNQGAFSSAGVQYRDAEFYAGYDRHGEDYRNYHAAATMMDDLVKKYDATKKGDVQSEEGWGKLGQVFRGAGQGVVDKATSEKFWSALSGIRNADALRSLHEKVTGIAGSYKNINDADAEKVLDEKLTDSEKALLAAYLLSADKSGQLDEDIHWSYRAGESAAESAKMALEFLAFSGATSVVTEPMTRALSRIAVRGMEKLGLEDAAKGTFKYVTRKAVKAVDKAAIGDLKALAGGIVQTALSPTALANQAEGLAEIDQETGKLASVADATVGTAIEGIVENATEFGLGLTNKLTGAAGKLLRNTKFGRALTFSPQMKGLLAKEGIQSLYEEWGEEVNNAYISQLTNALSGGKFGDANAWKSFWTAENQATLLFAFVPTIGGGAVVSAGQKAYYNAREASAGKKLDSLLEGKYSQEQIKDIHDSFKGSTPEELFESTKPFLGELLWQNRNDKELTTAIVEYSKAKADQLAINGAEANQLEQRRNEIKESIQAKTGAPFYVSEQLGDSGYTKDMVDVIDYGDGNRLFVIGQNGDAMATIDESGKKGFINQAELDRQARTLEGVMPVPQGGFRKRMALEDFLGQELVRNEQAEETRRMQDENAQQKARLTSSTNIGDTFEYGPAEHKVDATIIGKSREGVAVEFAEPVSIDGNTVKAVDLSWEKFADISGRSITAYTDKEQTDIQAHNLRTAEFRRKAVNASIKGAPISEGGKNYTVIAAVPNQSLDVRGGDTISLAAQDENGEVSTLYVPFSQLQETFGISTQEQQMMQEPAEDVPARTEGAENESLDEPVQRTETDFRGNPIPYNSDGSINEAQFFENDPEAWAKWNDSQRQDGGIDSLEYLSVASRTIDQDIAKTQAETETMDIPTRRAAQEKVKTLNARKALLESLIAQQRGRIADYELAPHIENLQAFLDSIKGEEAVQIVTSRNYAEAMRKSGCSQEAINKVTAQFTEAERESARTGKTLSVGGFFEQGTGIIFIFAEGNQSVEEASVTFNHERQHARNRRDGNLIKAVVESGVAQEDLLKVVTILSGSNAYKGLSMQALADEFTAFALEDAAINGGVNEQRLKDAGADENLINIIKEEYGRQNSDNRDSGRADTLYDESGQGDSGQDGSAPSGEPGEVAGQGLGTVERSGEPVANETAEVTEEPAPSQQAEPIQGLEDYTEEEIIGIARNYVEEVIADNDLPITIVGLQVIGSRKGGTAREDSDLDILIEYQGDMKEDSVFNALNDPESHLYIGDISVDFFTIRAEESGNTADWLASHNNGIQEKIQQAREETDTNPTDAQKEAGNYKKGHFRLDGFDISLEQPKGSIRRGKDADGKEWESEMKNDYGYIKGAVGVDGDQIDVFLSDNPTEGNVYVVDQVDPKTGKFDEHKVMYGFNSVEEAQAAYLSNYEEGWQGLGTITPVSKEEFKKWVESSTRKTKPFAEYSSVKPLQTEEVSEATDAQGNPIDAEGNLILETISSIDELTDNDFTAPYRSVQFPDVPGSIAKAIGGTKPVIIKKNVFEQNASAHKFTPEQNRQILNLALYSADLARSTQRATRPNYKVVIKIDEKSPIVILDVAQSSNNTEIVGWYTLDARNLKRIERQTIREGGELLVLSPILIPKDSLSALKNGNLSENKGANNSDISNNNIGEEKLSKVNSEQKVAGENKVTSADLEQVSMLGIVPEGNEQVMFRVSNRNRQLIGKWVDKYNDAHTEEKDKGTEETIRFNEAIKNRVLEICDTLEDASEQLAYARWFCLGAVNLNEEDLDKVRQAVASAKVHKVDPLQYDSPMALLDQFPYEKKGKAIDPDKMSTLHKAKEVPNTDIVIYDVEDSDESRQNMREIINTHFGVDCSPWCLLQGDGAGKLTSASAQYWRHYNAYPKQVAFKGGKLLAFSANDSSERVWWDRQDKSYKGLPITGKIKGDELGRSGTIVLSPEDGSQIDILNLHKGDKKNGLYQEWDAPDYLARESNWKDGKLNGKRISYFKNGQVESVGNYENGKEVGEFLDYYENGSVLAKGYFNNGKKQGEDIIFYENGKIKTRRVFDLKKEFYSGFAPSLIEEFYENGRKKYIAKDNDQEWSSDSWDGKGRIKQHEEGIRMPHSMGDKIYTGKSWSYSNNLTVETEKVFKDGLSSPVFVEVKENGKVVRSEFRTSNRNYYPDVVMHGTKIEYHRIDSEGNDIETLYIKRDGQWYVRETEVGRDGKFVTRYLAEEKPTYVIPATPREKYEEWMDMQLNSPLFRVANENQRIFISNAETAVNGLEMKKASGEQWIKAIQGRGGLKAEEDKWLGLSDWLTSKKEPVTKEELLDFIRENAIQIQDVNYAENVSLEDVAERQTDSYFKPIEELQAEVDELYNSPQRYDVVGEDATTEDIDDYLMDAMQEEYGEDFRVAYNIYEGRVEYAIDPWNIEEKEAISRMSDDETKPVNETRLNYTTNGLENKREIALTVPNIEPYNESDLIHFGDAGEGRAVAWIRFGETYTTTSEIDTERKTQSGDIPGMVSHKKARVLVIDEIQSKRHQDGRENGYDNHIPIEEYEQAAEDSKTAYNEWKELHNALCLKYPVSKVVNMEMSEKENNQYAGAVIRRNTTANREETLRRKIANAKNVPDAPFQKNWHELAMKRMLRLAAEEGYDYLAWTTGEQQAERYNMESAISALYASKNGEKYDVEVYDNNGNIIEFNGLVGDSRASGTYSEEELVRSFGKEATKQIVEAVASLPSQEYAEKLYERANKSGKKEDRDAWRNATNAKIDGSQLFKGEGMKGFYDQILPRFMDKYGKKWGVKTEDISLPNLEESARTMHSVPVTEEMKASVMQGQPMFRVSTKKKTPETASSEDSESLTVISSVDGANIIRNLDIAIEVLKNKSNNTKTFIGTIAKAINAHKNGSNSEYATFEAKSGKVFTLRLSNHNAKTSSFDNRDERYGISIVISNKANNGIYNDGEANIKEYFYSNTKIRKSKDKPLVQIAESIKQSLYSGVYIDKTGFAVEDEANVLFRISPEQDAEYMEAVNAGDMEKAGRMVRDAFKAAFPNTKVVDENGEPLMVFHGTQADFNTFILDNYMNGRTFGEGYYFTTSRELAQKYADKFIKKTEDGKVVDLKHRVIPAYINIVDMIDLDFDGADFSEADKQRSKQHIALWNEKHKTEDGLVARNIFDGYNIKADTYVVYDNNNIKSAEPVTYDDKGNVIPLSQRFNAESNDIRFSITEQQDKEYADAVSKGDTEKAKRMLEDAFLKAFPGSKIVDEDGRPKVVYHNTNSKFAIFDESQIGSNTDYGAFGFGFYFTPNKEQFDNYGKIKMSLYLDLKNPLTDIDEIKKIQSQARLEITGDEYGNDGKDVSKKIADIAKRGGYDGIWYNDGYSEEIVVFNPSQIKSADIETYDEQGNLIPLSQRFNPESEDIRYRFIGEKGVIQSRNKFAIDNARIADRMYHEGKDARTIKMATGWERGLDRKWRFEEPDFEFKDINVLVGRTYLDDLINDEALFKEYPILKNIRVGTIKRASDGLRGSLDWDTMTIGISKRLTKNIRGMRLPSFDPRAYNGAGNYEARDLTKNARLTLLHEIQHAIQHIEGFATGTNEYQAGQALIARKDQIEQDAQAFSKVFDRAMETDAAKAVVSAIRNGESVENVKKLVEDSHKDEIVSNADKLINAFKSKWGFDPNKFLNAKDKDKFLMANAYGFYQNSLGEVEARNVSERADMTQQERFYSMSMDTAKNYEGESIAPENVWVNFRLTTQEEADKFNASEKVSRYKTMQTFDGLLYPPMDEFEPGTTTRKEGRRYGDIDVAEENLDRTYQKTNSNGEPLFWPNGKPKLAVDLKRKGTTTGGVNYNPYGHSSNTMFNDQFTSAWKRDNLVVVRVELAKDDIGSGYWAEGAANSVGDVEWKNGEVSTALAKAGKEPRVVTLSRYTKIVEQVPWEEVADHYAEMLKGTDIVLPFNTVVPQLRDLLVERGVQIGEPSAQAGSAAQQAYEDWKAEKGIEGTETPDYDTDTFLQGVVRSSELAPTEDKVAQSGLASVIGTKKRNDVMMRVYRTASESVRQDIIDNAKGSGYNFADATAKTLAGYIAGTEMSEDQQKAVDIASRGLIDNLGDMLANDAKWMLYLDGTERDILSQASRAGVAFRLGFDNYTRKAKEEMATDVRFRTAVNDENLSALSMYNSSLGLWAAMQESHQDMYAALNRLTEAIAKSSGKPVQTYENVALALNQLSSKNFSEKDAYKRDFLHPMWQVIQSIIALNGLTADRTDIREGIDGIARYVMLKHGLERNEVFAKRDAKADYKAEYDAEVAEIKRLATKYKKEYNDALNEAAKTLGEESGEYLAEKERIDADYADRLKEIETLNKKAQDTLDRHYTMVDNGTAARYKEHRKDDYSGLMAQFFVDEPIEKRRKGEDAQTYEARKRAARKLVYDNLEDAERAAQRFVADFEESAVVKADNVKEFNKQSWLKGTVKVEEGKDTSLTDLLWERINACTKETLRHQYASGMISKAQYDSLKDMFKFYVPLRGFDEKTNTDLFSYINSKGDGNFTAPILKAKGRKSVAENPFGVIGNMAESAIQADNKNFAKHALYKFVSNRPGNGLAELRECWFEDTGLVDDNGRKIFKKYYPNLTADMTQEQIKEAWDKLGEEMQAKAAMGVKVFKGTNKLDLKNSVVQVDPRTVPEHMIRVMVNGKEQDIIINGNPRAAQELNGLLNIEADPNGFVKGVLWVTRIRSALATSWNLNFLLVTNFTRDIQYSQITTSVDHGAEFWAAYNKNLLKFIFLAQVPRLTFKYRGAKGIGKLIEKYHPELVEQYEQFVMNGGPTGYSYTANNKEWDKEMETYFKEQFGSPVWRAMKGIIHTAADIGESIELIPRFAAYITAKQLGMKDIEAVNAAKEVTLNFNRKGSGKALWGKQARAFIDPSDSRAKAAAKEIVIGLLTTPAVFRLVTMFYNASVQGAAKFVNMLKEHPAKMVSFIALHFALGAVNALIHAAMGGDDDDNKGAINGYFNLPDFIRWKYFSFPTKKEGQYFTLPLSQEFSPFYAMGDIMITEMIPATRIYANRNVALDIAKSFDDVLPLDVTAPFTDERGFGWGVADMLARGVSVTSPAWSVMTNRKFTGAPIYYDSPYKSQAVKDATPHWTEASEKTKSPYIWTAKQLNALTGGDDVKPGVINLRPEVLEYLIQETFSGAGKFWEQVLTMVNDDTNIEEKPFASRLYKTTTGKSEDSYYREEYNWMIREYLPTIKTQIDGYKNKYFREHPEIQEEIDKLNALKKNPKASNDKKHQANKAIERLMNPSPSDYLPRDFLESEEWQVWSQVSPFFTNESGTVDTKFRSEEMKELDKKIKTTADEETLKTYKADRMKLTRDFVDAMVKAIYESR